MMVPWWMRSPSPFTLIQWIILTLIGMSYVYLKGYKAPTYRKKLYLFSCTAFTLGFVVLSSDLVWSIFSLVKWYSLHPDSLNQMILVIARDFTGVILSLFGMVSLVNDHWVQWSRLTSWLWGWNIIFFLVWFGLSPSPAYTDWTYAFRYGYSWNVIWMVFFISHVLGRILTTGIYLSLFNRKK